MEIVAVVKIIILAGVEISVEVNKNYSEKIYRLEL